MSPEERRMFLEASVEFFRCPNTGRVIEGLKGDDKVLCHCGKTNPGVNGERPGVHIRSLLSRATVDEYLKQEEAKKR